AGVGRARAAQIVAALELGRRTLTRAPNARVRGNNAREAAAYLLPRVGARPTGQFGVGLLDTKHRVTRTTVLASGTLKSARGARQRRGHHRVPQPPLRRSHPEPRGRGVDATPGGGRPAHGHRSGGSSGTGGVAVLQPEGDGTAVSRVLYFDCFSGISGDMAIG